MLLIKRNNLLSNNNRGFALTVFKQKLEYFGQLKQRTSPKKTFETPRGKRRNFEVTWILMAARRLAKNGFLSLHADKARKITNEARTSNWARFSASRASRASRQRRHQAWIFKAEASSWRWWRSCWRSCLPRFSARCLKTDQKFFLHSRKFIKFFILRPTNLYPHSSNVNITSIPAIK